MLNPGTYLQNRYEILEKIGSGGMSVVYKAQCHTLNRLVAIKVLKEEFAFDRAFIDKFRMEAQAAARLSHPNIVSVYDVVEEGALHYIVMELIEGVTSRAISKRRAAWRTRRPSALPSRWRQALRRPTAITLSTGILSPRILSFPGMER